MSTIHHRWQHSRSRREALLGLAAVIAGSPRLRAQQDPRPLTGHKRIPGLAEMMSAFDFEPVCAANVPLALHDYTAQGSDGEFTLRRNREAFEWVDLVPRAGVSASAVSASTEILGMPMAFPLLVAPSGNQGTQHPDAEAGMYRGATAAGIPMIVANGSTVPIEKVAASANGTCWSQFYPNSDLTASRARLEHVQAAGVKAVVVTVDQIAGSNERDPHYRHLWNVRGSAARAYSEERVLPVARTGAGLYRVETPARLWYNWKYLDDIRPFIKVPMVIKGILSAEDAAICAERGYDALIVSNHGGRAMDYCPSTLEVLPEIVEAVKGRIPILVDSGFRRGADIVKAIALGANAVCLGRAPRWALGAFGAPGVQRLFEILQTEFREAMATTGCTTLTALNRASVRTRFS